MSGSIAITTAVADSSRTMTRPPTHSFPGATTAWMTGLWCPRGCAALSLCVARGDSVIAFSPECDGCQPHCGQPCCAARYLVAGAVRRALVLADCISSACSPARCASEVAAGDRGVAVGGGRGCSNSSDVDVMRALAEAGLASPASARHEVAPLGARADEGRVRADDGARGSGSAAT